MGNDLWTAYQLTFKLLTPMHIGWRKVGNLQQTRPYVPSHTFWGAMTARLAREAGAARDNTLYKKVGEQVANNLRFSYFYLIDQLESELSCLAPPHLPGSWPWQIKDQEQHGVGIFDWKYLTSYAGSPITNQRVSAEGGLHETEYIMPFTREARQVYLIGCVFERNKHDSSINNWKQSIARIQLGGERSYGWGRLAPAGEHWILKTNKLFGAGLDLSNTNPIIIIPANGFITSHVISGEATKSSDFEGRIEMLTSRLTTETGKHGRNFAALQPCWVPGTRVTREKCFYIGSKGTWKENN